LNRWSKAILAKDNEIFGKNKTILEIIDEDIVGMPNEDDVQFQLDVLLRKRAGRSPIASGSSH
jgi:hypothetical protein